MPLYTMNGADWSKRYPLIVQDATRIKGSAILDAEAVWLDANGMADFEAFFFFFFFFFFLKKKCSTKMICAD